MDMPPTAPGDGLADAFPGMAVPDIDIDGNVDIADLTEDR